MQKRISLLFFGIVMSFSVQSQILTDSIMRIHEDSLTKIFKKIAKSNTDDTNQLFSNSFEASLSKLLAKQEALRFGFDSLKKYIGVQTSEDGNLRFYNWNLFLSNGKYRYSCLVQYFNKENKKLYFYRLQDKTDSIADINNTPSSVDIWFGCLYYQIVQNKVKDKTVYTLLGWNGHTLFSNRKLIETLSFTDSGKPQFGKTMFVCDKIKKRRIVFEYTERSSMSLRYDERLEMIIFDHLSPTKDIYKGHSEYYGSDFSYDGLVFDKGVWTLLVDVDVRNIKPPKKELKSNKK